MYELCNQDEFEPRITPKPATKFDCFAVPSVPEVSLIFDKPMHCRTSEFKNFNTPPAKSIESNDLKVVSSASPSSNANGSYAAWREQNFSLKPSAAKVSNSASIEKIQYDQNYVRRSLSPRGKTLDILKERKANEHTLKVLDDSTNDQESKKQGTCHENSYQVIRQTHGQSRTCIKQRQNFKAESNGITKNNDVVPTIQPSNRSYSNNEDSAYNRPQEVYSPFSQDRRIAPHSLEEQRIQVNGAVNTGGARNLNGNPNTFNKHEFQNAPPHLGYHYPYLDMNPYPFPQFYGNLYSNHSTESQETIKNLLQLINSQNEQIKSLQTQVDRLLKMQEESFKERKKCVCSNELIQKSEQVFMESCGSVNNPLTVPQTQSTKNIIPNSSINGDSNAYFEERRNRGHSDSVLSETQSKKAFMEQKVSIGVMTSFELTVQNSPFALDSEDYENREAQRKPDNLKMSNGINLHETNESLRRYKNSFTRVPGAQLENIVEDSESYLSSSQQQSSNLTASVSTKDLEKQTHTDAREVEVFRSDSPRLYENMQKKIHQSKPVTQRYSERVQRDERKSNDVLKTPILHNASTECNTQRSASPKTNLPPNIDQYANKNTQRHNISTKTNSKNSPTNHCKQRQTENHIISPKAAKCVDDSLILSGGDLKVNERPPPTPEPSIHVEMHEYSSDEDSEKVKRTSKVGWTFYNNVLGQVNQILQNSSIGDDQDQNQGKVIHNAEQNDAENRAVMDTVKVATLEQLRKLGISLNENSELRELNNNKKLAFDSSYYPRLDCQANMTHATSAVNETNTSMHMKALALKYLSDEQLAELAVQRQGSTSLKHVMLSNVQATNMSFATMRYLERYQLLPGKNNLQGEGNNSRVNAEAPARPDMNFASPKNNPTLQRLQFSQTPRTSCPSKILDISTLKQQPKLL